ncbi:MAG: trypsin-like peptidase domain-containing protein [Candidatus Nanopelagicales bacterium]|nr:trypsin-like peptidase domain-containing protein [Candidatus Nanopelagicales bacterium]
MTIESGQEPTPAPQVQHPAPAAQQPTFVPIVAKHGPGLGLTVFIAAVTAAVVGLIAGFGGYLVGHETLTTASQSSVALPQAVTSVEPAKPGSIAAIVDSVLPSVVSIVEEGATESASGSGFVLRSDGYILTNNHVVDLVKSGAKLSVILNDGTTLKGTVVGTNPSYDLAVVKVDSDRLVPVTLGNSDAARVGDAVIAIGAPLGLAGTVTSGIVSALDRPVTAGGTGDTSFINAIQTDAAINPGNSGGPLLDGDGHVIAINSAIATLAAEGGDSGSIGLGFAIPVNSAKRIAEEIIATGDSRTPIIGVSLDMNYEGPGAKLIKVTSGGAAAEAGLQVGDVITRIGDRVIDDATELVVAIRTNAPGDAITIAYERGGRARTATITLGSSSGKG